jgi:hypothetical protein
MTTTATQPKTFYFNTGVSITSNSYLAKGDIWSPNMIRQIPFVCEGVPENASFAFACDHEEIKGREGFLVVPIIGGNLLSKFAWIRV